MTKDIEEMSFEEAMRELEQTIRTIDSGSEGLDSAISAFERGTKLRLHCQKKLSDAKLRIEKIIKLSDGNISTEVVSFKD